MAGLGEKKAGEQQLIVLAHLMKLRRACCHPVLAGGLDSPSSSKLDALEELLEGLIENGHRTLVFSQFTDHLALIRARLDARGWGYETLEGSTPAQERGALVNRFQTGTAPVFLISLQAGGTGLNLTAADYVVHMDPWWNPAVEDQASDRAHRLGQTRPVTIYRLVARDTIEERIVALHRSKRDLAEALLEGTEAAARLGAKELLERMAGTGSPA
jgi:SNF2 family DNA or RNA helicase